MCGHPSSNTHVMFAVGVGLGFEQLNCNAGMPLGDRHGQRRLTPLRTNNNILRDRPREWGHSHLAASVCQNYSNLHQNTNHILFAIGFDARGQESFYLLECGCIGICGAHGMFEGQVMCILGPSICRMHGELRERRLV